ncbi:hypothetical protein [Tateyamaria pelophila]|uniref:hypothetical protein n=1 Tax=Tateyamaria pelophila TaxID=328415 RepID=UPI001CC1AB00|nr:hypothetical protein [Tateyamaria pelophila]
MKRILFIVLMGLGLPAAAQFNSAAEVKPILQMTKANWIAVREYDGQDLLYFTHLEVFRCGLERITFAVNGGQPYLWQTPPCEGDETFSEIPVDRLPYVVYPLGSIATVRVQLIYDDGTIDDEVFERAAVMTP